MAQAGLFIGWGAPVPGREAKGLEVFNDGVEYWGRLQQEGRIESFDVVLLSPNGGMDAYIEVQGSAEQLAAVPEDDEFPRRVVDATLVVDDFKIVDGVCNEGVAANIALFQEAIAKVAQPA